MMILLILKVIASLIISLSAAFIAFALLEFFCSFIANLIVRKYGENISHYLLTNNRLRQAVYYLSDYKKYTCDTAKGDIGIETHCEHYCSNIINAFLNLFRHANNFHIDATLRKNKADYCKHNRTDKNTENNICNTVNQPFTHKGDYKRLKCPSQPKTNDTLKKYKVPIILLAIVLISLAIRVIGQWDNVFRGDWVAFIEPDGYYHARLYDVMARNFPNFIKFDQLAVYPGGGVNGYTPMLQWLVVSLSWLSGSTSQLRLDTVAALLPPIIGALLTIPFYLIGKEVFQSKAVGLAGALFIAIMPSEFFHRSLLGFVDNHIMEVLFTTLTILFLIHAVKRDSFINSMLAGISLGCLYLSSLLCFFIIHEYFT